jgi:hypothetical protein
MGTMDFEHIKTKALGIGGRPRPGRNRIRDVFLTHGTAAWALWLDKARGAFGHALRLPSRRSTFQGTAMPNLRPHLATRRMDCVNHLLPAIERNRVEKWNSRLIAGGRAINDRTFRKDQADLARRSFPVIFCILAPRDAFFRK